MQNFIFPSCVSISRLKRDNNYIIITYVMFNVK